ARRTAAALAARGRARPALGARRPRAGRRNPRDRGLVLDPAGGSRALRHGRWGGGAGMPAPPPTSGRTAGCPANSPALALALAPARGRGSVGGVDFPRAVAAEGDDVVAVLVRAFHAGRAHGHAGHGEAGEHRAL